MEKTENSTGKMMKKYILVSALCGLIPSIMFADTVDDANITTFQSGTPAVAADVNGNFSELTSAINDNAVRVESLESDVSTKITSVLNIVCAVGDELQVAIDDASLAATLDISVSGNCSAVSINRDHVSISGPASIQGLTVQSGTDIVLDDLTLDTLGTGESALLALWGSDITASNLGLAGDDEVVNLVNSTLKLGGANTIDSVGDNAVSVGGGSIMFIGGGTTAITAAIGGTGDCAVAVRLNSTFVNESDLTLTGDCIEVDDNGSLVLGGGVTVVNALVDVEKSSTVTIESRAGGTSVAVNGGLNVGGASTAFVDVRTGGAVTLTGDLTVGVQSTFGIQAEPGSTATTNGNVLVAGGSFNTSGDGDIQIAVGAGDVITTVGGTMGVRGATIVQADLMDLKFGGTTSFGLGSSIAANTLIEINFQHQFLWQTGGAGAAIDSGNVSCPSPLGAVHLAVSVSPVFNPDLCL